MRLGKCDIRHQCVLAIGLFRHRHTQLLAQSRTGTVGDDKIEEAIMRIEKLGGLTPRSIRTHLGLNKPIYRPTAAYGHFGRKPHGDFFPWERLDLVEDLKAALEG